MPITIQGSRSKSPGRGLDQEDAVRAGIEAGDTVYVYMNRVYFSTEIERDQVKYRALVAKPPGAS